MRPLPDAGPGNRFPTLRVFRTSVLVAVMILGCGGKSKNPCPESGEWCEGNQVMGCIQAENGPSSAPLDGVDCGDYHAECIRWDQQSNSSETRPMAGCAIPDDPCTEVGASRCETDSLIAFCEAPGRWVLWGCAGHYCVETGTPGHAVCSILPESCKEDDVTCWPDFNDITYLRCRDSAWIDPYTCDDGGVCLEVDGGGVTCAPTTCSDGEKSCLKNRSDAYVLCVDGRWSQIENCPSGEICLETYTGEDDCQVER